MLTIMSPGQERQRRQTATMEGECSVCSTWGSITVWESWTRRWGLPPRRGNIRVTVRCETCGCRTRVPSS